jgi:hypothetical protein
MPKAISTQSFFCKMHKIAYKKTLWIHLPRCIIILKHCPLKIQFLKTWLSRNISFETLLFGNIIKIHSKELLAYK